jgi:hypothetical protein
VSRKKSPANFGSRGSLFLGIGGRRGKRVLITWSFGGIRQGVAGMMWGQGAAWQGLAGRDVGGTMNRAPTESSGGGVG